jgi:hypothetical protein
MTDNNAQMSPERIHKANFINTHLPLMYVYGCSFAKYFIKKGIKKLSVYCDNMDFGWGRYVLLDIALNPEIVIDLMIGNMDFYGMYPYQNLYQPSFFANTINLLTPESNVLVLSSDNAAVELIKTKTEKIHNFIDFWFDCLFGVIMGNRFAEIHEMNPFLPVVIYPVPHFPNNKEQYSDIEKQIEYGKNFDTTILPKISSGGGVLSRRSIKNSDMMLMI